MEIAARAPAAASSPSAQVEAARGRGPASTAPPPTALVDGYEDAQLKALKTAFLFAALLVLASLFATGNLPAKRSTSCRR